MEQRLREVQSPKESTGRVTVFGIGACIFGGCRLCAEKKIQRKKENNKNHPTTTIATRAGEAYSPNGNANDILGTSGTGKAMEPWHEG